MLLVTNESEMSDRYKRVSQFGVSWVEMVYFGTTLEVEIFGSALI
jgi:hypothetical protein